MKQEMREVIVLISAVIAMLYFTIGFYLGVLKRYWTRRRLRIFMLSAFSFMTSAGSLTLLLKEEATVSRRIVGAFVIFVFGFGTGYWVAGWLSYYLSQEPFKSKYHVKDD